MQFKILSIVATALSVQSAYAMSSTQQASTIVTAKEAVDAMTQISNVLGDAANVINNISLSTGVSGTAKDVGKVVTDITGIVGTGIAIAIDLVDLRSAGPIQRDDQLVLCAAFQNLVNANQKLVDAINGKDGLIGGPVPALAKLAAPIINLVRTGVEQFARGLIGSVPNCQAQAQSELDQFQGTTSNIFSK